MHTVWGNSPFCITADAVHRYDPSREKAILENPQIFQNCKIINNISADDAQSKAERISNRPTQKEKRTAAQNTQQSF